jgi:tRNA threonylcarbamoyladenosine biosynthesis protein TsaB
MMLAIDTSTRNASVALSDGVQVVASRSWRSVVNHSAELMPAVAQILQSRDVSPLSLDAVAVALGPGGFSALRAGLSVAKGLAMAARIPIIGIGSLDLEAFPFRDTGLPVCALLEAGRGEASSALFSPTPANGRLREDRISGPDELLNEIEAFGGKATLFCGEGMAQWAEAIKTRLGDRAALCHVPPSARAESLAVLAFRRLEQGDADDLDLLQPNYLRMPSIGVPKRRDRKPQASSRSSPASNRGA